MSTLFGELRGQHDAHMKTPPVLYRGVSIQPISHQHQPYWLGGGFVFWGFGLSCLNVALGATWFRTVGSAKTAVDCMWEAGWSGDPHHSMAEWATRFWELLDERRERLWVGDHRGKAKAGPVPICLICGNKRAAS